MLGLFCIIIRFNSYRTLVYPGVFFHDLESIATDDDYVLVFDIPALDRYTMSRIQRKVSIALEEKNIEHSLGDTKITLTEVNPDTISITLRLMIKSFLRFLGKKVQYTHCLIMHDGEKKMIESIWEMADWNVAYAIYKRLTQSCSKRDGKCILL